MRPQLICSYLLHPVLPFNRCLTPRIVCTHRRLYFCTSRVVLFRGQCWYLSCKTSNRSYIKASSRTDDQKESDVTSKETKTQDQNSILNQTDTSRTEDADEDEVAGKRPGLLKRFHQTYKQHGKILISVHLFTSAIWASSFYYAAVSGVDIVPFLEWIGFGEKMIAPFKNPGVSHAAVTYLMYKLATPARYTVTIGGTHLSVRYLRRWGYLPHVPDTDRIRSLVQEKIGEVRDGLKDRQSGGDSK